MIGLSLKRYGGPGTRLDETSNVKVTVTVHSKKRHLRGMDQPVEEGSYRDFVAKNDYVQVSDGSQVQEVRKTACAKPKFHEV